MQHDARASRLPIGNSWWAVDWSLRTTNALSHKIWRANLHKNCNASIQRLSPFTRRRMNSCRIRRILVNKLSLSSLNLDFYRSVITDTKCWCQLYTCYVFTVIRFGAGPVIMTSSRDSEYHDNIMIITIITIIIMIVLNLFVTIVSAAIFLIETTNSYDKWLLLH